MPPRSRNNLKKGMSKGGFFSDEINPNGMSIGNFKDNVRRAVSDVKSVFSSKPKTKVRRRGR